MSVMVNSVVHILLASSLYAAVEANSSEPKPRKANRYLLEKWGKWYTFCDINHDGVISLEDPKHFESFYKGYDCARDEKQSSSLETMVQLWKAVHLFNNTEISQAEFVQTVKQQFESNNTAFYELVRVYMSELSKFIDCNADDLISNDEFLTLLNALGHNNTAQNEKQFFSIPDINGKVPPAVVVANFMRFVFENDKSKPDIFKNSLDYGI
ncbi:sarcoplasmic calcium-binding protein-like [Ruditapes philippinarum]|uniref:sarcoplasmic calcium-binding protein-like n=1 Tax=Ruditapes philippinarum TaxID=129788 RepID=UPI00295A871D|nr:sarcoplasmic calcium-binding protein-like [Ruditapes philippinarum]